MSNLTTAGAGLIGTGASVVTGLFLALGTGQAASGLLGEPSGDGYARQAVTLTPAGNELKIGAATFGPFDASHGTMSHAGLYTAASGGSCVWVGALDQAVDLIASETVTHAANASKITLELAV